MRPSRFVSVFVGLALLPPAGAAACSCIWSDALSRFSRADTVFLGRVSSVMVDSVPQWQVRDPSPPMPIRRYRFEVLGVWKGRPHPQTEILTSRYGASCGDSFEVGQDYVVFGQDRDGEYWTSLCAVNPPLRAAIDERHCFGEPEWRTADTREVSLDLDAVFALLSHYDTEVYRGAVSALRGATDQVVRIRPRATALLQSADRLEVLAGLEVLAALGPDASPSSVPVEELLWSSDTEIRLRAYATLVRIVDGAELAPAFLMMFDDESTEVRLAVIQSVGRVAPHLDDTQLVVVCDRLVAMLNPADPATSRSVLFALRGLGPAASGALPAIEELAADPRAGALARQARLVADRIRESQDEGG